MNFINVDDLAQEIRRVNGDNSMGAGQLAETIVEFVSRIEVTDEMAFNAAKVLELWGMRNGSITAARLALQEALK